MHSQCRSQSFKLWELADPVVFCCRFRRVDGSIQRHGRGGVMPLSCESCHAHLDFLRTPSDSRYYWLCFLLFAEYCTARRHSRLSVTFHWGEGEKGGKWCETNKVGIVLLLVFACMHLNFIDAKKVICLQHNVCSCMVGFALLCVIYIIAFLFFNILLLLLLLKKKV